MLVTVKVSPRRYLTIETTKYEDSWYAVSEAYAPTAERKGLSYACGTIIAGPGDWSSVIKKTIEHATQNTPQKIITLETHEAAQKARSTRIREANKALGLGAVRSRVSGDEEP